jgi:hypothetical protein
MLGTHAPHTKSCEVCARPFTPARMGQRVCGMTCARKVPKVLKAKERAETKARLRALETIPELIAIADRAFMSWIRERDRQAGLPCISSGKPLDWSENRHRAGNAVEYRIRLIERIGLEEVEALESSNEPHHWTREELREIAAKFRAALRELKKGQEA